MRPQTPLSLQQLDLLSASEWKVMAPAWSIVRVTEGLGYCLGPKQATALSPGEIIIVPPNCPTTFRSSQLGQARLHYLQFEPHQFNGLLTLSEQRQLAVIVDACENEIRHLQSSHPVSEQFVALCQTPENGNRLLERCQMLALIATVLGPRLKPIAQPEEKQALAMRRFRELIGRLPEAELVEHRAEDLARECGCSVRHFTRLFHEQFGLSLKARQTQFKLEKARQLLWETNDKVINIALDSGYRHLGLFNAMFKRRFGLTPTKLRRTRDKRRKPRPTRPLVFLFLLLFVPARLQAAEQSTRNARINRPIFSSKSLQTGFSRPNSFRTSD